MKNHLPLSGKTFLFGVIGLTSLGMILSRPMTARANSVSPAVERNQAVLDFPTTITFQLTLSAPETIDRIVLEYGVDRLTCGEVVGKAFPEFEPSTRVETEWTWDMRRSGSEPPGARIWWQWRVFDAAGDEQLIERSETIWLDSVHDWKQASADSITLHWYAGNGDFGADMLGSAAGSVRHIAELIDLQPDGVVDLYLYASYEDLHDAVLYEAGWTGGLSYGDHNIIILGVPRGYEDWAKKAIAHELMHNVVDRFTFSCLVRIPAWIHEGLAMVSEGGPEQTEMAKLENAIRHGDIYPLRTLSGGFPEDSYAAELAYSQSYSVVDFLMQQGDPSLMRKLLSLLAAGATADGALQDLYGFNVDGLDAAWRLAVGAEPLPAEDLLPTLTPTFVPTYRPLGMNPAAVATAGPATPIQPESGGPSWGVSEILILLCLCCLCLVPVMGICAAVLFGLAWGKK